MTASSAPAGLGRTLNELGAVHRRLVRRDAKLCGRQRRQCLELLQSSAIELEAEFARAAEVSARLNLLAQRQLTRARAVLHSGPPPLRRFACLRTRAHPTWWAGIGALLYLFIFTVRYRLDPSWAEGLPSISWPVTSALMGLVWALAWPSSVIRLEFDGESLRAKRSLGFLTLGAPRQIDLVHVDEVRVSERGQGCTLSLASAEHEFVIGAGQRLDDSQFGELLQWCTEARLKGGAPKVVRQSLQAPPAARDASSAEVEFIISVLSPALWLAGLVCAAAFGVSNAFEATKADPPSRAESSV